MHLNNEMTYSVKAGHRIIATYRWSEWYSAWQCINMAGEANLVADITVQSSLKEFSNPALGFEVTEHRCGWCPRTEREQAAQHGRGLSHGICPLCKSKLEREAAMLLQAI